MRARLAILFAGTVALGGCSYGYGGYGPYGGVSAGVSYGSGYGGYYGYNGCYDPYSAAGGYGGYDSYGYPTGGYGYGSCSYGGGYGAYGSAPYYGWYGDYYYPGVGTYVYDRYRRPHTWSNTQQRYWSQQRQRVLSTSRNRSNAKERATLRENWSRFDRTDRNTNRDRKSDSRRPQ
jgi:hypothetical protein